MKAIAIFLGSVGAAIGGLWGWHKIRGGKKSRPQAGGNVNIGGAGIPKNILPGKGAMGALAQNADKLGQGGASIIGAVGGLFKGGDDAAGSSGDGSATEETGTDPTSGDGLSFDSDGTEPDFSEGV